MEKSNGAEIELNVAQPLPIGFPFLETSALGFAKITCIIYMYHHSLSDKPPKLQQSALPSPLSVASVPSTQDVALSSTGEETGSTTSSPMNPTEKVSGNQNLRNNFCSQKHYLFIYSWVSLKECTNPTNTSSSSFWNKAVG